MTVQFNLPEAADDDEAAAIAAAIRAHIAGETRAEEASEPSWDGARWGFAGRVEALQRRRVRVPTFAPRDSWLAASRSEQF